MFLCFALLVSSVGFWWLLLAFDWLLFAFAWNDSVSFWCCFLLVFFVGVVSSCCFFGGAFLLVFISAVCVFFAVFLLLGVFLLVVFLTVFFLLVFAFAVFCLWCFLCCVFFFWCFLLFLFYLLRWSLRWLFSSGCFLCFFLWCFLLVYSCFIALVFMPLLFSLILGCAFFLVIVNFCVGVFYSYEFFVQTFVGAVCFRCCVFWLRGFSPAVFFLRVFLIEACIEPARLCLYYSPSPAPPPACYLTEGDQNNRASQEGIQEATKPPTKPLTLFFTLRGRRCALPDTPSFPLILKKILKNKATQEGILFWNGTFLLQI